MKRHGWKLLIVIVLTLSIGLIAGCKENEPQGDMSQFDMLRRVVGIIEQQYGGEYDADDADLVLSQALVESLDPYSYLSDGAYTQVSSASIGVYTRRSIYNEYFVTDIAEGLPCDHTFENGFKLQRGDEIYAIGGKRLRGLNSSYFSLYTQGDVGTDLVLTIYRNGVNMGDYTYTKVDAIVPRVFYAKDVYGDGSEIGYIRLTSFSYYQTNAGKRLSPTGAFAEAMTRLAQDGQKGLILDLRDNGGGSVAVMGDIASYFVPHEEDEEKVILQMVYAKTGETHNQAAVGHDYVDIPLTILVNGNSASASEALVGACRAFNPHVTVIGTETYGKGVFQNTGIEVKDHTKDNASTFDDTYYLVLVAGYYYIVDPAVEGGRYNIHGSPLTPDVIATTESIGALKDDAELVEAAKWFAAQLAPQEE